LTHGTARYRSAYLRQPKRTLKPAINSTPCEFAVMSDGAPGRNPGRNRFGRRIGKTRSSIEAAGNLIPEQGAIKAADNRRRAA
jgi:hypothetical protein